jgi:ribosomal protein L33
MKNMKRKLLLMLSLTLMVTSCNLDGGSSPIAKTRRTGNVTVQSGAYTNDGSAVVMNHPVLRGIQNLLLIPPAYAAAVTDFQFCITKLKVVSEVDGAAGASSEAILGLVDVSDPNADTIWGNIELPEGAQVSEIHFEVHQDSENCSGANYSVSYNGKELTKDLEFKFKFDPAISIQNGDTLDLGLSVIAKAMEDADAAAQFNDAQIGNYVEVNTIGTGEKL